MADRVYYSDDTLTLLLGDARDVLSTMAAGSVKCVVTSPPYYGLRDYEGNPDQIGLEQTPAEYVARLVAVFDEVRRVLTDDGTLWLNVGDSYAQGRVQGRLPKNLLGIPWRTALALQDAGWYLRNAVVWHKPNAMPESVRDRLSTRYEMVFLLTKSPRYWFDLDPIREPHTMRAQRRFRPMVADRVGRPDGTRPQSIDRGARNEPGFDGHPLGRNPGDVWAISTRRFSGAHWAPFPIDLPKRCIAAGCPPEGIVLDPFSGAGTTLMAARELGRNSVGIDINAKYHDIALRRMSDAPLPFGEVS